MTQHNTPWHIVFSISMSIFTGLLFSMYPTYGADINLPLQIPISGKHEIRICVLEQCGGISEYLVLVYQWLVGFAAVLAVLALTWGGVRWLLSGGESGKIDEARKVIGNAVIGLSLALGSYLFLAILSKDFVEYKPLRIIPVSPLDLNFELVEKYGEETGDSEEDDDEEELEFVFRGTMKTFAYYQLRAQTARFLFSATEVHAATRKKRVKATRKKQVKASGTLANIETYVANNIQFGIVPRRCLKWTRLALESIYKTAVIKKTPLYPREAYPAETAKHFDEKDAYIRSKSLSGIKDGDVVFMRTARSFLVTDKLDRGPGGDSISHIGVYYNGSIYHQFGKDLSKDVAEKGILKGKLSARSDKIEILGYGRMGF